MLALLGKITHIAEHPATAEGGCRLEISFKPACVLPQRAAVPEWIKDQVLKVEREVVDRREIGYTGDSIVLTPEESSRWLMPLQVTPNLTRGEMPEKLALRLRWWKDDNPPEYQVKVNGRPVTGKFTKVESEFTAEVETAQFFDGAPSVPVDFEITCDKLKASCAVLPVEPLYARKVSLPGGDVFRLGSTWYTLDVTLQQGAGGISSLHENGRNNDHFRAQQGVVQSPLEQIGHLDRLKMGWRHNDKMQDLSMSCAGVHRERDGMRIYLEGVVDEGQNLRTSLACTLRDDIPLVIWQRYFQTHTGKKKDDSKDVPEKPKELIDDVRSLGVGFRTCWVPECNGHCGSRVLSAYQDQLVTLRLAQMQEWMYGRTWTMESGWVVVEHPQRQECMMYLFDQQATPWIISGLTSIYLSLEPFWPMAPMKAGDTLSMMLAITAGERCGASIDGAWVACRSVLADGGVRCGMIGRFVDHLQQSPVVFHLGGETKEVALERVLLPGIGTIAYALTDFPTGEMQQSFDVTVAGVPCRNGVYA